MPPQIATGRNSEFRHLSSRRRPDAVELADRQGLHKGRPHARRDDEQPVRFAMIGCQLGEELVVRNAGRCGQAGFLPDAGFDLLRDRGGGPAIFQRGGHVQIGFVQRQWLDDRGVTGENRLDLPGHRFVDVEARRHEDQFRAFPARRDRCHGGVNPVAARLVACRRNDAAFPRTADGQWKAEQGGIIALLDGRVERIHVDMDDAAKAWYGARWGRHGVHRTREGSGSVDHATGRAHHRGNRHDGPPHGGTRCHPGASVGQNLRAMAGFGARIGWSGRTETDDAPSFPNKICRNGSLVVDRIGTEWAD